MAVEAKGTARVEGRDLRALKAFASEVRPRRAVVVCLEGASRVREGIEILPWRDFLGRLWAGEIIR